MSELSKILRLVVLYKSLILFNISIFIIIYVLHVYYNNHKVKAIVTKSDCSPININNKTLWECILEIEYIDPQTNKKIKRDVVSYNSPNKFNTYQKINFNTQTDFINLENYWWVNPILLSLIPLGLSYYLIKNRNNPTVQKYLGAASIVNII